MRVQYKDKIWDKHEIQSRMTGSNPEFVKHAVLAIYARQTDAEKSRVETIERNGIGFSGTDGKAMSNTARRLMKYNRWRNEASCAVGARRMRKYWRQLLEEIASKEGAVVLDKKAAPTNDDLSQIMEFETEERGVWG